MIEIVFFLFGLILIIGAAAVWLMHDPFAKLMALGLLAGSTMPFLVFKGYHDVAIIVALIMPISTIMILTICKKEGENES